MNLRSYLRLLRPLHAVFGITAFTAAMIGGCKLFFGCDDPTAQLLSLAFVMPFLTGLSVASAAHTAMHRPFFLLLPDGRRGLRRATFITLALAIPLMAAGLARWQPVPLAAAFGLTLALTPLPLTNPRRWVGLRGRWLLSVALGILLLRFIGAGRVVAAVQEFPWIIFAGGMTAAFWSLWGSFTSADARERAHTPYDSVGGIMVFHGMFNHSAHRRFAQEASQQHARLLPDRATVGQDWPVRQVRPDSGSWVRVLQHAAFGQRRGNSYLRAQVRLAVVAAIYLAGLPLLNLVMSTDGQGLSHAVASYWDLLAHLTGADLTTGRPTSFNYASCVQLGLGAALCLSVVRPQLAYPISRARLALVVFRQSITQLSLALVLPALIVFVVSLAGQMISGHFLPALGLPPLVALDLGLLPLLPLLVCAGTARHSTSRIMLALVVAVGLIVTAASRPLWADRCLTPAGLVVVALLTAATLQLLRWRLTRHYSTCDLTASDGRGSPVFGLPIQPAR